MRRHIMHHNYDTIKLILSSKGVRKPDDIDVLDSTTKRGYLDSSKYPWVKYVYEKLEGNNVAAQTQLDIWKHDLGQYFQINGLNYSNQQ